MPREITAFSNPLIKSVRDLRDKQTRREYRKVQPEFELPGLGADDEDEGAGQAGN